MFADVTFPVEGGGLGVVAEQASLNFDEPTDDGPGRATASVTTRFLAGRQLGGALDEADFVDLDDTDDYERRRLRVRVPRPLSEAPGQHSRSP